MYSTFCMSYVRLSTERGQKIATENSKTTSRFQPGVHIQPHLQIYHMRLVHLKTSHFDEKIFMIL